MRKTLLVTFVLLVLATFAVAQQGTNSQAGSSSQAPSASAPSQESVGQTPSAEITVEGCLAGKAGDYVITDEAGMTYKLQLAQDADNSDLDKYVGKKVRVKGTRAEAGEADKAPEPDSSAAKDSAGKASKSQTIKLSSIDKIADTCSEKSEAPPSN